MPQQVRLDQIAGKTVKKAIKTFGRAIIAFEDGDYLCLEAEPDGEEAMLDDQYVQLRDFHQRDLVRAGLMTEEEYKERLEKLKQASLIQQEKDERSTLERLLAKYGTPPAATGSPIRSPTAQPE